MTRVAKAVKKDWGPCEFEPCGLPIQVGDSMREGLVPCHAQDGRRLSYTFPGQGAMRHEHLHLGCWELRTKQRALESRIRNHIAALRRTRRKDG